MAKFLLSVSLFTGCLLALVGCGGGGDDNNDTVRTTPVTFQLGWAARTRVTTGPSSAVSATVTLTGAKQDGSSLVFTVDRQANPAAYVGTYTTTEESKPGTFPMTVRFYSQPKGVGDVVAEGQSNVTIANNGSGIGDITVTKTIASVRIVPSQIVPSSGNLQLAFIARDADGDLVATTPGSGTWTVTAGGDVLTVSPSGLATAVKTGTATVRVVVDGVTSDPERVGVAQAPIASLTVAPGMVVPLGGTRTLTFTARDADGSTLTVDPASVTWTVVSGNDVLSVSNTGVVTPLKGGIAQVRVSVPGIESSAVTVTVSAPAFGDPSFEAANLAPNTFQENSSIAGSPWTGVPNWGFANGDSPWGRDGHTGEQHGYIQAFRDGAQGELHQKVSGLIVGQKYRVTLWIARRNGGYGADFGAPVKVFADGAEILGATSPTNSGSWTQVTTQPFTATATQVTIRIQSQRPTSSSEGDTATLIDDIAITYVR